MSCYRMLGNQGIVPSTTATYDVRHRLASLSIDVITLYPCRKSYHMYKTTAIDYKFKVWIANLHIQT